MTTTYLLTGDIGGTSSRMVLYDTRCVHEQDKYGKDPLVVKYFRNAEHLPESVRSDPQAFPQHILVPFLKLCFDNKDTHATAKDQATKHKQLVPLAECQIMACLATAGLVINNGARLSNLNNLLIDGSDIEKNTTDPYLKHIVVCRVINDFVAQGYGCLTLLPHEVRVLHGPAQASDLPNNLPVGPKVCVGAGTGLGECYLTPNNVPNNNNKATYSCFPSEGGHVEFAPRNELEMELLTSLSTKFGSMPHHRISVERVVSGIGLANVYEFLSRKFPDRVDPFVHAEFEAAGDEQGRVVSGHAQEGTLCLDAMQIMMRAYGCEVGSAAIKWIPTGGLFVTGGLTPKNIKFIEGHDTEFMRSYLHKGRASDVLDMVPLFAVMTEDLGVRGVHKAAVLEYEKFRTSTSQGQQHLEGLSGGHQEERSGQAMLVRPHSGKKRIQRKCWASEKSLVDFRLNKTQVNHWMVPVNVLQLSSSHCLAKRKRSNEQDSTEPQVDIGSSDDEPAEEEQNDENDRQDSEPHKKKYIRKWCFYCTESFKDEKGLVRHRSRFIGQTARRISTECRLAESHYAPSSIHPQVDHMQK